MAQYLALKDSWGPTGRKAANYRGEPDVAQFAHFKADSVVDFPDGFDPGKHFEKISRSAPPIFEPPKADAPDARLAPFTAHDPMNEALKAKSQAESRKGGGKK